MLRTYKKQLILSSLLTLLPIPVGLVLWDRFPAEMAVHWGLSGQPDGWAGPALSVIAMPLVMVAMNLLCFILTLRDPGNKGRNRKPLTLVLWIVPLICNFSCYSLYALALGMEFSVSTWMSVLMGGMFAVIGNYMPKMKMNSTMGIKVPWTYSSEENWNATHRFGGKVWLAGGIAIMFCSFLPEKAAIPALLIGLLIMTVIPVVYSYRYYKRQKAEGNVEKAGYSSVDKKVMKFSLVFLVIVLVFVMVVLFTGKLEYFFLDNELYIEADFYTDYTLDCEDILSVEYREGNVPGTRVGGFGSFRLLMGFFQNEEFGTYIRYTYYRPEGCVVIRTDGRTLVLSGENAEETRKLYQELEARINN